MSFALRIKELREERRLSQASLARELGVGTGSVGMWESSGEVPPVKKLTVIADHFGVSLDYLVGRSEVRYPVVEKDPLWAEIRRLSPEKKEIVRRLIESWKDRE